MAWREQIKKLLKKDNLGRWNGEMDVIPPYKCNSPETAIEYKDIGGRESKNKQCEGLLRAESSKQ